jgi:hypothetical protein
MDRFPSAVRNILWGIVVWLVFAAGLAGMFYPLVPHTRTGWLLFIAFSPPLYLLSLLLGQRIWSSRLGLAVADLPSKARICLGVLVGSAGLIFATWVTSLFTRY